MFRKRDAAVKLAIGLSALLVGIAFGRWGAKPAWPVTQAAVSTKRSAPNDSHTTTGAAQPVAARDRTEEKTSSAHPSPDALAGILKDGNSSERLHALTDFIDHLAPGDFAAAMLVARKLPGGPDRDLATRLLVARWAELDPEAALGFAAKHKEFGQITSDIFQQLAGSDLTSALTRAQAITDPGLHYQALRGALGVMAQSDPAGAFASPRPSARCRIPSRSHR